MAVGRGLFVSFEGMEGAGKTAQARALAAYLGAEGHRAQLVREPGGTPLGERIRDVLLHAREIELSAAAEALLFSAARAELVAEVIRPALSVGTHVIADRYFDSTLAYQGFGHGADLDELRAVTRFTVSDVVPDLTVLLDLPVDVALERVRGRSGQWDRFEAHESRFHDRVRDGYVTLARADPQRFLVVDALLTEGEVARRINARVNELLTERSSRIGAHP